MTHKNFEKEKNRILEIFQQAQPIHPKKQAKIVTHAKKDFAYFLKTYLSHYLSHKLATFQYKIIRLLNSPHQYIAIAAPRGFAKSTLVSFAYIIWAIITEKYHFIILISATDDLASDLSQFIRLEFSDNPLIKRDFGNLINYWGTQGDFVIHHTRVFARGRRQATRGFRYREHRPDLIILDDIEKDEEAINPIIAEKTLSLIYRSLLPSLCPHGKIIAIGTILHAKSAFGCLMTQQNIWQKYIFQAIQIDEKGIESSLWEARFPITFLQNQRKIMGVSAFNTEYQNIPNQPNQGIFREEMLIADTLPTQKMVMFIDPSVDGVKNGDYKACVLIRGSVNKIEVVDLVMVQRYDRKFFLQVCHLYQRYQQFIISVGIESNGFQHYFAKELDNFAKARHINLPLKSIKHHLKKEYRIQKLLSLFETDRIVFNPNLLQSQEGELLKEQLIFFPNPKIHDDAPDALAAAIELLLANEDSAQQTSNFTPVPIYRKRKFS